MQDFGQHGRELITNEVALKLLQLLAHDAQLVKFCAAQGIPSARLLASLKHVVMKVRACVLLHPEPTEAPPEPFLRNKQAGSEEQDCPGTAAAKAPCVQCIHESKTLAG